MFDIFGNAKDGFWKSDAVKRAAWIFVILSFIGFADAFYLTIEHYRGGQVVCLINSGCDKVLSGSYSAVFGVPLALLGLFYYLFIFSTALFFAFGHSEKFFKAAIFASPVGFLASLWFVSLQLFVIKAICFYCMISAFSSLTLFLTSAVLFFKNKSDNKPVTSAINDQ